MPTRFGFSHALHGQCRQAVHSAVIVRWGHLRVDGACCEALCLGPCLTPRCACLVQLDEEDEDMNPFKADYNEDQDYEYDDENGAFDDADMGGGGDEEDFVEEGQFGRGGEDEDEEV